MTSTISTRPRSSSLTDRAAVRGVKRGGKNRRRRREAAAPKKRVVVTVAKGVAVIGLAVGLGVAALEVHAYAKTSDTFALARIDVTGNARASDEALVRLCGLSVGDNLLEIDVEEIARMVAAHPWVAEATVTRSWPKNVELSVVEHEPRVLVALDHLYYANAAGEIVKRYSPGERESLPIVTGLSREEIETDEGESRARLLLALRFLTELDETLGAAAPTIAELNVDGASGVAFTEADDDTRIVIGHPPWGERIARIEQVKEALTQRGVDATSIMLDGNRRKDRAVARLASTQRE